MAITLKRQLNDDEKKEILERYGKKCYINGHTIPDNESVHFDHIFAFALGGPTELNNIAPMCEYHNKSKGTLALEDYRNKLELQAFFNNGDKQTLKQFLQFCKDKSIIEMFGQSITITTKEDTVTVESPFSRDTFSLYQCPLTKWSYFYAILPANLIDSDDDYDNECGLQPRYLIFDKVFDMYRHLQSYPVLQPSIGRVKNNKILIFDGQHKIASLLLNKRKDFECKIYIDPDVRLLNQANIAAHDKFAQTRFYSSVMILKLGSQFGSDFEEYKNLDGEHKSESRFIDFLRKKDPTISKGDINRRFRSYLYNSVLEDTENKMKPFISNSNRSTAEQPVTIDMLQKSVLGQFVYDNPVDDDLISDKYKRDSEMRNTVNLLNVLVDRGLISWDSSLPKDDLTQLKLKRLFSSKSIMAWTELLKDSICAKLDITDGDDRLRPFYRDLSPDDFSQIQSIFIRLYNWQLWQSTYNSEIDSIITGSKSNVKAWFKSKGLTTGYLLGADI